MKVSIFEVGARDGLQNEKTPISTARKLEFIAGLERAGLKDIEAGLFVRPDRVPQMADSDAVMKKLLGRANPGIRYWGLVPNLRGLERAEAVGARHLALFTAATESFARRNIGMSIRDSLIEFRRIVLAAPRGTVFRGYVSTAFGCPFEGKVPARQALKVVEALAELGCKQISVGDTIGVATPNQMDEVMKPALKLLGPARLAGHFHDTRGTALANALRSIELGVRVFDSSAGGLGGCPFAPGAKGNLATEDLVYMLDGMGIRTGVNLKTLARNSLKLGAWMGRPLTSRYLQATAG
jgi:isopropylmalate/homocitrate/citramalate synthase